MDYFTISMAASVFLLLYAVIYFVVSKYVSSGSKSLIKDPGVYFKVFGFLFACMSLIFFVIGLGQSVAFVNQSPCENIVNSSIVINSSHTSYTYVDSCVDRDVPKSIERLYVITSYLLYLQIIFLIIALFVAIIGVIHRW